MVIVGGSVAGCTAALLYARNGYRVAVLEKKKSAEQYKILCTHFIQPVALPVLRKLGVLEELEALGAVRTKAAFWTKAGWIDPSGDYQGPSDAGHAYNIERRILDPFLRAKVEGHPTADLFLNARVTGCRREGKQWRVMVAGEDGSPESVLFSKLVVAADGRTSGLASLLGNEAGMSENQRAAFFGYFEGTDAPRGNRSYFLLGDKEMGFIYPLQGGRVLLSVYVTKETAADWRKKANLESSLVEFFREFPDLLDLSRLESLTPIYSYKNYPNLTRNPVCMGIPFIGDAVLSLDPMSGVGCGFALVAAEMLVRTTCDRLNGEDGPEAGLQAYNEEFNRFFLPHAQGIKADSKIAKSPEALFQLYRRVVENEQLQHDFIALTGRILSPASFQRAYLMAATKGG